MLPSLVSRADNWADFLRREIDMSAAPVNLLAIARSRRVKKIALRFMVPRGLLLPVIGGYEIYIRNSTNRDLDILDQEKEEDLVPGQRFTLAHEIAHTLFFRFADNMPSPDPSISNELLLEDVCDRTAGQVLVPTHLLKHQIAMHGRVDSRLVLTIAKIFRVSLAVVIERLSAVAATDSTRRCILLVRKLKDNAEIKAAYFNVGLLPFLRRPKKYSLVTDWVSDFPVEIIDGPNDKEFCIPRKAGTIKFSKVKLPSESLFLIEGHA